MSENPTPQQPVHPGGLGNEEELERARRVAQQLLDAPYQDANNRHLGPGSTILYTMPNETANRHRFEVVPAIVVKQWAGGAPVLRVLGVHQREDFTVWCTPFTIALPGTPEAAGAWSWAYAGCPQCPCGKGGLLFTSSKRCTACDKSPEEILAQWSAPVENPAHPTEKGVVPR